MLQIKVPIFVVFFLQLFSSKQQLFVNLRKNAPFFEELDKYDDEEISKYGKYTTKLQNFRQQKSHQTAVALNFGLKKLP